MGMNLVADLVSPHIAELLNDASQLTPVERVALAKLLLESVLTGEVSDEAHWTAMGLDAFQNEWDNSEDAIYDNWKELYGVPAQ